MVKKVMLLGLVIGLMLGGLMPAVVLAQGGGEITLVPFESEAFGLQGVVPEGWKLAAPGVYQRQAAPGDLTSLIQQAAPGISVEQLAASLLPRLGLTELPEPAGTLETAAFSWTLYSIDVTAGAINVHVDMALATTDEGVVLVLLQSPPDEADALAEAVFMPAVEALAPLAPAPVEDLPYRAEEVQFENPAAEGVTLAGTLTLPQGAGPHPAVILISGSGPSDRDESILPLAEIKPFALIADYLTRQGIAVLRYDDRGVGDSTGEHETATSADLASDVEAAIAYLLSREDINPAQIGLLGHSEGGVIAPMVAARNPNVAFVISLAGSAVPGYDVLVRQNERLLATAGVSEEEIAARVAWVRTLMDAMLAEDWAQVEGLLREDYARAIADLPAEQRDALGDVEAYIDEQIAAAMPLYRYWMPYFLAHDPAEDWRQVTVPVLAFFGGLDVQVDADQNRPALEAALAEAGNDDVTVITIENANHLFQPAETGSVEEYGALPQEFVPELLPTIADWLLERVTLAE
ncbi:MAG: hypothetical protein Kow0077_13850 [Anaerolineae bacterium]